MKGWTSLFYAKKCISIIRTRMGCVLLQFLLWLPVLWLGRRRIYPASKLVDCFVLSWCICRVFIGVFLIIFILFIMLQSNVFMLNLHLCVNTISVLCCDFCASNVCIFQILNFSLSSFLCSYNRWFYSWIELHILIE